MRDWNLKQLAEKAHEDLQLCHTNLERQMCTVICNKEIRERAAEISNHRKLTPGEWAIANAAGYRA